MCKHEKINQAKLPQRFVFQHQHLAGSDSITDPYFCTDQTVTYVFSNSTHSPTLQTIHSFLNYISVPFLSPSSHPFSYRLLSAVFHVHVICSSYVSVTLLG